MAYYQLEDGSVYTAAQFKRKWPGGKIPSPAARRLLGIKKISKKQYDDIRLGHLPKRYYHTTKSGKRVYNHRKNPSPSKKRVTYYANVGPDAYHFSHTTQIFDKLKDAKAWVAKNKRASGVWAILRSEDTRYKRMSMSVSAASDDWTREMAEKYCKQVMRNPSPSKTSYGVDTKAVTRKMKPVKRKGKTNGAIKTRVGKKNPSPVSTTMIPYRAHIVGDNIDGYYVFLIDRRNLHVPRDDRRRVSLTKAREIAKKAGVPVSRQKVSKVRTLKPQAKRKNPSHRKGSLTDARAAAKNRLDRVPFGSIVMVGQWLDTGKYEAKTGGGMNWKHKYFMPVEQWTSVPYKTKPGKKMVKIDVKMSSKNNPLGWQPLRTKKEARTQAITHAFLAKQPAGIGKKSNKYAVLPCISPGTKTAFGWKVLEVITPTKAREIMKRGNKKNPGMGRLSRTLGEGLMPKPKKAKKKAAKKKATKKKTTRKKNPPPLPGTVIPAYGRDYKTAKEAKASWNAGKDWIIADMSSPWDGKPISKRDFPKGTSVTLRFGKLRKTTRVTN